MNAELVRRQVRERLARQRLLVAELLGIREQLGGSLFARYSECRKPGCVCRTGRKHGPYYVLSQRSAGRGEFRYLERGRVRAARGLVRRHREFRRGMARLRRINLQLVTLLRAYQEATVALGSRRLELAQTRTTRPNRMLGLKA
jgi:hypothetical protein